MVCVAALEESPTLAITEPEIASNLPVGRAVSPQGEEPVSVMTNETMSLEEEKRLVAAAQRDPAAFGPLYERYTDQIYRYIYRRVGDHDEAEDLTAQAFQQALAALPAYQWRGLPFGAWLYRIAGNLIIRHRKVRGREVIVEHVERIVDERGSFSDPADALLRQASTDQLLAAVRELSHDQQQALVLKYSHGMTNQQVGALMGRTEGGVKQLVHRAMLVLRSTLYPQVGD
jgi:RNA polymerase sigma-70 factor, ECF subfamily